MEWNKKTIRNVILAVLGCILFYWALQNIQVIGTFLSAVARLLNPFLVGGALAFILNVPMRAIERKLPKKLIKGRRSIALSLTFLLVISVLAIVLLLLIPQMSATIKSIGVLLPGFWASAQRSLADLLVRYPLLEEWLADFAGMNWNEAMGNVMQWLRTGGLAFVGSTVTAATGLVSGLVNFFIGVVFAIYLLSQKETLARQSKMLLYAFLPAEKTKKILDIATLTSKTFSNFLSGQCVEACILGSMFAVSMLVCRMPYVTLISVLIGVTALIPIFGAFIGCFVGAFLILVQNPMQAVWFVVLFLCLQQIEGNLIYPKVVGNSVGLPSIWVLAAVTIGGSTMGITGMLIMIPLCSVMYSMLRTNTRKRLSEKGVPRKEYTK